MKNLNKLILASMTGATILASDLALADQAEDHGLYLGAAWGMARVEDSDFDDDNDYGQVFVGYQILPFLGVEGAYYDFGRYGNAFASTDTEATSLAITGRLPISEMVALYANFGPVWWETDVNYGSFRGSADGEDLKFGAGISLEISPNLDLHASYDWIDVDLDSDDFDTTSPGDFDSDLRTVSIGLKFQF